MLFKFSGDTAALEDMPLQDQLGRAVLSPAGVGKAEFAVFNAGANHIQTVCFHISSCTDGPPNTSEGRNGTYPFFLEASRIRAL